MNRDCDTFCWQDYHKSNAIGGLTVILVFLVFNLTYRSIHSIYTLDRNIHISPFYTYFKGIFQVILLVFSLILKKWFISIFNILYCFLILVYFFVSYKLLTYNYKRIQLMQIFAICGIFWSMVLTTVFELVTEG